MKKLAALALFLAACGSDYAWPAKTAGEWKVTFPAESTGGGVPCEDAAIDIAVTPVGTAELDASVTDGSSAAYSDCTVQTDMTGSTASISCGSGAPQIQIDLADDGTTATAMLHSWEDGNALCWQLSPMMVTITDRER